MSNVTANFSTAGPFLALPYHLQCSHLHWAGDGSLLRLPSGDSPDSSEIYLTEKMGLGNKQHNVFH